MDITRFGMNTEQQALVDGVFLEHAIDALGRHEHYLNPPLRAELEAVYLRSIGELHGAVIENREPSATTLRNLGHLSFIHAFGFPSTRQIGKTSLLRPEPTYWGLFEGLLQD